MLSKRLYHGFTLAEIAISIVVIGILFSAVVPKLISSQAKARDLKRKVDIQQIGNALMIYKSNVGTYPQTQGTTATLFGRGAPYALVPQYISSLPLDPIISDNTGSIYIASGAFAGEYQTVTGGSYEYMIFPDNEGTREQTHFILGSQVENTNNGNWMGGDASYSWVLANYPYEFMGFWTGARGITAAGSNMFALSSAKSLVKNLCKSFVFENTVIPYIEGVSDNTTEHNGFGLAASGGNVCHLKSEERYIIKYLYVY